jgi:hypothetical protein
MAVFKQKKDDFNNKEMTGSLHLNLHRIDTDTIQCQLIKIGPETPITAKTCAEKGESVHY